MSEKEAKKILYEKTIASWSEYLDKIYDADDKCVCLFCADADNECKKCKIKQSICSKNGFSGHYNEFRGAVSVLYEKTRDMIKKLRNEYTNLYIQ